MTRPESDSPSFLQSVLDWLHKGYPEGIPQKDYYPLLALLARTLSEDEIVQASWAVLKEGDPDTPVTEADIREAVRGVIVDEPSAHEINQVAARLAVVGWPLADHF